MINKPPLKEKEIKEIVKTAVNTKLMPFPTISAKEVLKLVQQFLDLRKWVDIANFPLLCNACKNPLHFVSFSYKCDNFFFLHCWNCHSKPDFGKFEPHVSFGEFKKTLDKLIEERNSRGVLFG